MIKTAKGVAVTAAALPPSLLPLPTIKTLVNSKDHPITCHAGTEGEQRYSSTHS
jgi:hypothetical protein